MGVYLSYINKKSSLEDDFQDIPCLLSKLISHVNFNMSPSSSAILSRNLLPLYNTATLGSVLLKLQYSECCCYSVVFKKHMCGRGGNIVVSVYFRSFSD